MRSSFDPILHCQWQFSTLSFSLSSTKTLTMTQASWKHLIHVFFVVWPCNTNLNESAVSAAPIWFPKSFRFPLSSFHFTLMAVMVAAESGQSKRTTPFFAFATLFCPPSRSKNSQQPVTIQHQKAGYHTIPTRLPSKSIHSSV